MYCKKTKPGKKREKRKNVVIRFITCDDISIKHTCTCTCTVQHVLYTTYITHVCGTTNRVHMVYTHMFVYYTVLYNIYSLLKGYDILFILLYIYIYNIFIKTVFI